MATSLVSRHISAVEALAVNVAWRWDDWLAATFQFNPVVGPMSWIGAILVVVGVGRILFLDD